MRQGIRQLAIGSSEKKSENTAWRWGRIDLMRAGGADAFIRHAAVNCR